MPLTPQQRYNMVVQAGLDPNKFDYVEGETTDLTPWTSEAAAPVAPPAPQPMGIGASIGARLKRAIVPGLTALPGMGYGAEAGSVLGPVGTVVGGLLGGMIGGGAGAAVQEPIFKLIQGKEGYQKGMEEYNQAATDHPVVSVGTDVVGGMAGGFKPSLGGIKALGKLAVGVPLNKLPQELSQPLIAGGVNAALGGGLEGVHQVMSDEELDPEKMGMAALMSFPFNKPRFNAKFLGGSGAEIPAESNVDAVEQKTETPAATPNPIDLIANRPQLVWRRYGKPIIDNPVNDPLGSDYLTLQDQLNNAPEAPLAPIYKVPIDRQIPLKTEGPVVSKNPPIKDHGVNQNDAAPVVEGDPVVVRNIDEGTKYFGDKLTPSSTPEERRLRFEAKKAEILRRKGINENELGIPLESKPLPKAKTEDIVPAVAEVKKPVETIDPNHEFPILGEDGKVIKEETEISDPTEKFYQPADKSKETHPNLTDEDKSFADDFAAKRGAKLEYTDKILHPDGGDARGDYNRATRVARLSDTATADTAPHELGGHAYFEDLLKSKLQADRVFAEKGIKAAGGKEALAEAVGKRIVEIKDGGLKSWLQDFWSNGKRIARLASDKDVVNHSARRALDDKPFSESPEFHGEEKGEGRFNQDGERNKYWLDPENKTIDAEGDHAKKAGEILKDSNEPNPIDKLKSKGWLRVQNIDGYRGRPDEIVIEGNPTAKQLKHLKDKAIEEGKALVQDQGGRRPIIHHDPEGFYSGPGEGVKSKEPSKGFKGINSVLNTLEELDHPHAKRAAEATKNFLDEQRSLTGLKNKAVEVTNGIKDKEAFRKYAWEMANFDKSDVKLTPGDKKIADDLRQPLVKIHEIQRAEGLTPDGVGQKDNPNYFPQMVDNHVLDVFAKGDSGERAKLRKDFIDHIQLKDSSIDNEQANTILNEYLKHVSNPSGNQSPEFKALRAHAGKGIPLSWLEKDPAKLYSRYFDRAARDIAFFKHIQKDPALRSIFNVPDLNGSFKNNDKGVEPISHPVMKILYKQFSGEHTQQEGIVKAVEHFFRSVVLGPVTGAVNFGSAIVHSLPYLEVKEMGNVVKAFGKLEKGLIDSMETGINRQNITEIETGARSGVSGLADRLKSMGDIIRKYSGTNFMEQYSRAHSMMVGEMTALSSWGRAAKGDIDGLAFLKKFGPKDVDYRRQPIDDKVIKTIATNFVEKTQGSYGPKGLPAFMMEPSTPWYWLLSLNKWSIERANIFKEDVINPAIKGDWAPLIKLTVGSLLGGAAINEVREIINNKKSQMPTWKELDVAGKPEDYAYKVAATLNAAGFGGVILDVVKAGFDKANKNKVNTPNNLAVQLPLDITSELVDALNAAKDGEDVFKTLTQFTINTIVDTTQATRVLANNTYRADDMKRADKFRDMKVYKKLTDQPVGESVDINRYEGETNREFKRATTLEEGQKILKEEILPQLTGLTKEERKKKLENLKRNSYQTVPSDAKEAKKYREYLVKTQGEEFAGMVFKDHKDQVRVNHQKAMRVPRG